MTDLVQFKRGLQANLPSIAQDGVFYLTTDTNRLYIGQGEAMALLNQTVQIVDRINNLPANAETNDFYYCSAENVLAIYTGAEKGWIQVNPDTGVIGVDTEGKGNAITEVSYDAATRKITFTLGETFALQEDVEAAFGEIEEALGAIEEGIEEISGTLETIASPMIYKGVVNSDIELATKEMIVGHTYMVGTAGAYEDKIAEVGDLFICNGETWTYVPAGDDADTDTQYSLAFGANGTINLYNETTENNVSTLSLTSNTLEITNEDSNTMSIELCWGTF